MRSECTHIKRLLSDYIDGALDAAKMTAVSEHLHVCRDCSREHAALASLIRELGNIRAVRTPENFVERLHVRINEDSIFSRIREVLSFTRIRMPVELAAFATTVALILLFFNFFPSQEKGIINMPGDENTEPAIDHRTSPAQTAENQDQTKQPADSSSSALQIKEQRIPVRLALSLITRQEAMPIPSQSVSFGNSLVGNTSDDLYLWQNDKDDNSREIIISPDEVNQKIDEIIKSVEAKMLSRENNIESGYPASLTLEIPGINYRRFISKIEMLGALKHPYPDLPEGSDTAKVLIQMELSPQE